MLYPAAHDVAEDNTFFKTFVGFLTGHDLNTTSKQVLPCELRIRGQNTTFLVTVNTISGRYANEQVITINDMGEEGVQMFSDVPSSVRLVMANTCS